MTYKLNSPCKDCPDRFVGCHGKCEKYKAYRVEVDKYNEMKAKLDYAHDPMTEYLRTRKNDRLHKESRKAKK